MRKATGSGPDRGPRNLRGETGRGRAAGDLTGTGTGIALSAGLTGAVAGVCRGLRTRLGLIMNRNGRCRESPASGGCRPRRGTDRDQRSLPAPRRDPGAARDLAAGDRRRWQHGGVLHRDLQRHGHLCVPVPASRQRRQGRHVRCLLTCQAAGPGPRRFRGRDRLRKL
jgi:hypothetical protein